MNIINIFPKENFFTSAINSNKKTLLEKEVADALISSLYNRLDSFEYPFQRVDDKNSETLSIILQKNLQPTPSMPYVIISKDTLKGFDQSSNSYDGRYYEIVPNALVDMKHVFDMPFSKEMPVFLKAFVNENYAVISDFISDKNITELLSNKNNIALLATLETITPDVQNKRDIYELIPLVAVSDKLSDNKNEQLIKWSKNSVKFYSVDYFGFKKRINNF